MNINLRRLTQAEFHATNKYPFCENVSIKMKEEKHKHLYLLIEF